jgi:drug/metabolite transporter (DMT)-like permease
VRLFGLIAFTLIGFAANSLLTRSAITGHHIDPWAFMVVRLVTGTLMLAALVRLRRSPSKGRGSWLMGGALAAYAVLFTLAYVRIAVGPGALLLFGSVQLTMFATAHARGERLLPQQWIGVLLALGGFLVLTLPGLTAPDPVGALLMVGAGISWAVYSLAGRGSTDPLKVTADNFLRASAIGLLIAAPIGFHGPFTTRGVLLASTSGAIASALAYATWYTLLPLIPVWRAAMLQLSVPVLTALGAALLLREPIHLRLAAAMALAVMGIWLTTNRSNRKP